MKGYKALSMNMEALNGYCRNGKYKVYELGKWYRLKSTIAVGAVGFHFCDSLENLHDSHYDLTKARFFEIETGDGDVVCSETSGNCCSNKIMLVREVPKEEVLQAYRENVEKLTRPEAPFAAKIFMVHNNIGLDALVHDPEWMIRMRVAKKGYGLDILENDPVWFVRKEVAAAGHHPQKFIRDSHPCVQHAARMYFREHA